MPDFNHARLIARAVACVVVSSLLTTCGDDGSSSKEDRGVFGEMADALKQAEADYLTANAEIFASAAYMQPFIASLLDAPHDGSTGRPVNLSCLPAGMGGRTYTINGTPFTSVEDTSVSEFTARFRIFRLSNVGQPLLDQQIGHVDFTCASSFGLSRITEVLLFADSVVIAQAAYLGDFSRGTVTGLFRPPDGNGALYFHGGAAVDSISMRFDLPGDVGADYRVLMFDSGSRRVEAEISSEPAVNWGLQMTLIVDETDEVSDSGYVLYYPTGQSLDYDIASCVKSGTLDTPVFSPPTSSCFEGANPMSVNGSQLAAMAESYQSLRHLWHAAGKMTELCRSLIPTDE